MKVVPFKPEHLVWLMEQPGHEHLHTLSLEDVQKLCRTKDCVTILTDDDKVMVCGGIAEYWPGRGELWVTCHRDAKRDFVPIHSIAKRFLKSRSVKRVEAAVSMSMDSFGARWVSALGFIMEGRRLRSYGPGGEDCSLWARVG